MKTDYQVGDRVRVLSPLSGDHWNNQLAKVTAIGTRGGAFNDRPNDPAFTVELIDKTEIAKDASPYESWDDIGMGILYASEMEEA